MSSLAQKALEQIKEKKYTEVFDDTVSKIYCYGIVFCKKDCTVQCKAIEQ